jgi:hypothetical protein
MESALKPKEGERPVQVARKAIKTNQQTEETQ